MITIIYQIGDALRLVALPNGGQIQVLSPTTHNWVIQDQWTEA